MFLFLFTAFFNVLDIIIVGELTLFFSVYSKIYTYQIYTLKVRIQL